MPGAKSGTAGSPVPPGNPKQAEEADTADPGEVEQVKTQQRQTHTGKYGAVSAKPYKPPQTKEEKAKKKSWIEIELVGEDGEGIAGEKYRITLPDDSVAEGTLDEKGWARVEGFDEGTCKVCFLDLDEEAWEKI